LLDLQYLIKAKQGYFQFVSTGMPFLAMENRAFFRVSFPGSTD